MAKTFFWRNNFKMLIPESSGKEEVTKCCRDRQKSNHPENFFFFKYSSKIEEVELRLILNFFFFCSIKYNKSNTKAFCRLIA